MSGIKKTLRAIYGATFFYALHYALTIYLESSYLEGFLPAQTVGILFTVSAIISIIVHFNISPLLRRIGNYSLIISSVILEAIALFILAFSFSKELVVAAFVLHQVLLNVIFLSLTVFLEAYSKDETTGKNRGLFLTILNGAILLGPLMASLAVGNDSYRNVFLWSGILVLPILFHARSKLQGFKDPRYDNIALWKSFGRVISEKSLRLIFSIQFLLEFFYGVMVIYAPLYLHGELGISMNQVLGIIMPVALLPFVIFPYLLGNLADKRFGEKEFLFIGFLVIGLATFYLSFISSKEAAVWAIALFITRIGATFIETMAESYFFKHVDATDAEVIGFFRNLRPMSYVLSPVIASAFLSVFPFRFIFASLGIMMLLGLRYTLALKDTR